MRKQPLPHLQRGPAGRLQRVVDQRVQLFAGERLAPDRHGLVGAAAGDGFPGAGQIRRHRDALGVADRAVLVVQSLCLRRRLGIHYEPGKRVQFSVAEPLPPGRHLQMQSALADEGAQLRFVTRDGYCAPVARGAVDHE